jgi:hypothetical protein
MNKSSKLMLAAAALALTVGSARADAPLRGTGGVVTLFLKTMDANHNLVPLPANPPDSTPLWGGHANTTLYAPDGHQLTWGEYKNVQGRAEAKCEADGTHVVIHVSGLVPKGVYTIWVLAFNGPFPAGHNPMNPISPNGPFPFGNLIGIGSLGANDGSENSFQASADGEGEITAVMPTGPFSTMPPWLNFHYNLEGCLFDLVEFHLVGVYHSDSMTYGTDPGYVHHAEVQFGIQMVP